MKDKKYSEYISDFLNFIHASESRHNQSSEELVTQDRLTQDLLHKLELEDLKYSERGKVATQLVENRKLRRYCKDEVEELDPIIKFIQENKKALNEMTQLLGAVRKAEKFHTNRNYTPRVLKIKENEE